MSTCSEPTQFQLLRAITRSGPMSRTELAERTGLSKASVSTLTRDLIERGMLRETGTVHGLGRPSIKLGLEAQAAYFMGVSLLAQPMALIADLHGTVHAECTFEGSRDPVEIGRRIAGLLPVLTRGTALARSCIRGVGIAVPGFVGECQEVCIQSTLLGWQDVPAARLIGQEIGLPTAIENDANAVTLGETLFGRMRDCASFSLVSVGEGIGCGHIIQGAIHRGHHGGAGEIAHATIEPGGIPCRCGKRGCLDTIASLQAIRDAARAAGLPGSMQALEQVAASGQPDAVRILHRAGSALGLAIAQLIQMLDPQQIVIVQLDGDQSSLFETVTRQAIEANVLPRFAGKTAIHTRRVSKDVWAQGAASVAAHNFMFARGAASGMFARGAAPGMVARGAAPGMAARTAVGA